MLIVTGKVVMIQSNEIVKSANDKFTKITLVITKQMKGVKRNICFESYGKVAKDILNFRKGDRVRVFFVIDSVFNGGRWYHNIKAMDVEKHVIKKKQDYNTKINFTDYDTIENDFDK